MAAQAQAPRGEERVSTTRDLPGACACLRSATRAYPRNLLSLSTTEDEREDPGAPPHTPALTKESQQGHRSPRHGHPKGYTTPGRAASSTRPPCLPARWQPCPAWCRGEPARAEESLLASVAFHQLPRGVEHRAHTERSRVLCRYE